MNIRRFPPQIHYLRLILVLIIASFFGFLITPSHPVYADLSCPFSFTDNISRAGEPAGIEETYDVSAGDILTITWGPSSWNTVQITGDLTVPPVNYPGPLVLVFPSSGAYDLHIAFTGPDAPMQRTVECHHPAAGSGSTTWFNPGDGRIDGRPGDRIAVWCNANTNPPSTPPVANLVVYGIGDQVTNNSSGFWLATFTQVELLAAGSKGIVKNAGPGNGTVAAYMDAQGNFFVAWNGGQFQATGHGDFAKTGSCNFAS